jgi:hypothetical protein
MAFGLREYFAIRIAAGTTKRKVITATTPWPLIIWWYCGKEANLLPIPIHCTSTSASVLSTISVLQIGREGGERESNHYISSSRNLNPPDSAAGNHCESHPTFRLQHTWCSRCMCCSRAARGCLGVPLLLRRSSAPALTHFCQPQLWSILCSVPSIAQCIVLNSI